MKKIILIDGGPASGKNTLGELLIKMFNNSGDKSVLLDLDTFVEHFNPTWIWKNNDQKDKDQLNARLNIAKEIDKYLQQDYTVIVIGERFLRKNDVINFISRLTTTCPVYLYHLSPTFALREERLHQRGPHSLIDLAKDQKERDEIKNWLGFVYENVNSSEVDAKNLMQLIREGKGAVDIGVETSIISISLPEYKIDKQPDYQAIGAKIDKVLEENFNGKDVAIRALSSTDHPQFTLDEFVKIILEKGTDKYDPNRKGVEGFEDYDVDFQAGFCTIGKNHFGEGADIIQKFYENVLLDRGYRLRIDVLLIYDLNQFIQAEKIDQTKSGVHPRLEPYMFKFKDPEHKQRALLGVIKLLR